MVSRKLKKKKKKTPDTALMFDWSSNRWTIQESNENLVESVLSSEVVGEITQIPAKVAITHQLSLPMKNTAL